jgi:GH24 family phage-related lysozyme (muramidase)
VIQHNEGLSLTAYKDSAGVPTICYGETKGVQIGQKRTLTQCQEQLIRSAEGHAKALDGLPMTLTDVQLLGALDLTYNIGISGFKNSTVKRKLMQGDTKGAAQAVLAWRYITVKGKKYDCSIEGNKVCYGLWKRRLWESQAIGNEFKSVQAALAAIPK